MLAKLAALDACTVSDALDRLGKDGVVFGLQALAAPRRIVGRAVTVQLVPDTGAKTHRHLGTAAVEASGPENIIVVAHDGRTEVAGWGGILSLGASQRGVAGVVIDGACRDVDEARDLGFTIYGRVGVPRTARGRIVELDWNVPVNICGVAVAPGDYIIADGSGVVVIPASIAEQVIAAAERIAAKEALMAEAVRQGKPVSEVMGADYETMLKGTEG